MGTLFGALNRMDMIVTGIEAFDHPAFPTSDDVADRRDKLAILVKFLSDEYSISRKNLHDAGKTHTGREITNM